jgi:hypothetical protein
MDDQLHISQNKKISKKKQHMKPKTLTTRYWIFTIIFALMIFLDGIGGISRQQAGIDAVKHLGYPVYLMTIAGVARLPPGSRTSANEIQSHQGMGVCGHRY